MNYTTPPQKPDLDNLIANIFIVIGLIVVGIVIWSAIV